MSEIVPGSDLKIAVKLALVDWRLDGRTCDRENRCRGSPLTRTKMDRETFKGRKERERGKGEPSG